MTTLTTNSLSHGNHTITAEYPGDGNFHGITNALSPDQIINTPPVAHLASYSRSAGASLQIPISNLITNFTSDSDNDVLALVSVGSGTNDATITTNSTFIYYVPSASNAYSNTTDHLDYMVTDGFTGGTATLANCTLVGNSSVAGGGIDNHAALTLTRCDVTHNQAVGTQGGGLRTSARLIFGRCWSLGLPRFGIGDL